MINIPIWLQLYDVNQNGNCYCWPLHLVTSFHISIEHSILFHRFASQKDIYFLKWHVACGKFIGVNIWAGSGIPFPPNSMRFLRRKKCCSVIWFSGADSGLVKLVLMTTTNNFNNQQHKTKIKRFFCVKDITISFFTNSWNQRFILYAKRENRPLQKTKFPLKFSSSES